jgi:hypothetical protein
MQLAWTSTWDYLSGCFTAYKPYTSKEIAGQAVVLQVKGPFGAPAQKVWGFETLMVVGAGIGATCLKICCESSLQDRRWSAPSSYRIVSLELGIQKSPNISKILHRVYAMATLQNDLQKVLNNHNLTRAQSSKLPADVRWHPSPPFCARCSYAPSNERVFWSGRARVRASFHPLPYCLGTRDAKIFMKLEGFHWGFTN